MRADRREALQKAIGYSFRDLNLLTKALTHRSYAYEKSLASGEDNEVLEFLGDSVVGLTAAELALRALPERDEGELTKLKAAATNTQALSRLARKIKLDKALLLGRGEEKTGGRKKPSILAGAFEALAGAVYLDGGWEAVRTFLSRSLSPLLDDLRSERLTIHDFKSALQEIFQRSGLPVPSYRLVLEKGLPHERTFTVEVRSGERVLAKAKGTSKKAAEQKAAEKALRGLLGRKIRAASPEAFLARPEDLAFAPPIRKIRLIP